MIQGNFRCEVNTLSEEAECVEIREGGVAFGVSGSEPGDEESNGDAYTKIDQVALVDLKQIFAQIIESGDGEEVYAYCRFGGAAVVDSEKGEETVLKKAAPERLKN